MPCYYPLTAWRSIKLNPSGKHGITFTKTDADLDQEMLLPCGQCIGCRLEHSRQWALRCVHESTLYDENCFLTLTYNDENLPEGGNLVHDDFQKFMKRLRKKFGPGIRYYMCGEYGASDEDQIGYQNVGRPHYHMCLFNCDFPDKEIYKTENGFRLYTSTTLNDLWGKGYCIIGDVTFESAAYVARYIMKKLKGRGDHDMHYNRGLNPDTGEIHLLKPEYTQMSRRPGIGKTWWDQFKGDTFKDFVTVRGIKMKPPKYYDKLLEKHDPDKLQSIKEKRILAAIDNISEQDCDRRQVRQQIKINKIKRLRRKEL